MKIIGIEASDDMNISVTSRLLSLLNKLVVSTIFTLVFFAELEYLGQRQDPGFYLFVFIAGVTYSTIFYQLSQKLYKKKQGQKPMEVRWDSTALGPFRSFMDTSEKFGVNRYLFELDFAFLLFSVFLFLGTHLFLIILANFNIVSTGMVRRDLFEIAFGVFVAYSMVLLVSFVASYETYLGKKKGRGGIEATSMIALIFFLAVTLSFLGKFIYDAFKILLVRT